MTAPRSALDCLDDILDAVDKIEIFTRVCHMKNSSRTIRDDIPPLKSAMRSLLNDLAAEEGLNEPPSGQRDR